MYRDTTFFFLLFPNVPTKVDKVENIPANGYRSRGRSSTKKLAKSSRNIVSRLEGDNLRSPDLRGHPLKEFVVLSVPFQPVPHPGGIDCTWPRLTNSTGSGRILIASSAYDHPDTSSEGGVSLVSQLVILSASSPCQY